MPAPRQVAERQWEVLLSFMEAHRELAVNQLCNTPMAMVGSTRLWEELANSLNSLGVGVTKTPAKWRDPLPDRNPEPAPRVRSPENHHHRHEEALPAGLLFSFPPTSPRPWDRLGASTSRASSGAILKYSCDAPPAAVCVASGDAPAATASQELGACHAAAC